MGFDAIDKLVQIHNLELKKAKNSVYAKCKINKEEVILIKPTTYMNLSGKAIAEFKAFYKIPDRKIIVIYDDKDTIPGNIRIRKNGGPGGHNGIKDILNFSKDFIRVRVGIGLPKYSNDMINHVIKKISSNEEYELLQNGVNKSVVAVSDIIKYGVDKAMNKHNSNNVIKKEKVENKEQKNEEKTNKLGE